MKDKKQKEKSTFSWIMDFAGQKKKYYVSSVILAVLGALFQVLPFLVAADIIDKLLMGNKDFSLYLKDLGIIALFWALRVILHGLSTRASHIATFNVLGNIRKTALMKLSNMPLGDVEKRGSGNLKNILVERIDSIETTLAHIIPEMTGNISAVIAALVYLFTLDWRMALISLITFPVGMAVFMLMMIGYEGFYGRTVRATKALNDTAVEYIGGIEVIKVFGKVKSSYDKFADAARECAASYVDWMTKSNVYFTLAMNVMPATLITVLPFGGYFLMKGSLTVQMFVLITIVSMGLINPIITCMSYSDDLAKLGTVLGEITDILTAKEMERPKEAAVLPASSTVKLNNVHFAYDEKEILHGINAEFKEGTVNALVGPSGSGKSTIAKLISSFWDVNEGEITIGGVDIRNLPIEEYYKNIAYVSQDTFLFDDTVRENIRMGNLSATDEEVEEAAKKCGCYDFIMDLEKGFDTIAGGDGSHLSGGERQRISIARAMLKNAPVIILDEATAYTDPENEALIESSVAKLVKDKTLIIIAHRLSTIVDADKIFVVNEGNIDESGTHEELLHKSPLYKKLWEAHISSKDSL